MDFCSERYAGGAERRHDGRIAVDERNRRWCSDGFEIGCDNGERVRVAFAREAMSFLAIMRGLAAGPSVFCYSLIVRMTLLSGRVLLDDSLSSCASISSYFGTVVTPPFGTMCTTL